MDISNHTTRPQLIFDGTRDNFVQLVLENSKRGTVLANYWSPKAGPCFKLWQDLEVLCNEYQGRLLLVNINTEAQRSLALNNGITSVPTLKVYSNGEVVDSIYGAESRRSIQSVLDKYVQPVRSPELLRALQCYKKGEIDDALKILVNHCILHPQDIDAHGMFLKLLLRAKRYTDISNYVIHLPESVKTSAEIKSLWVHARILGLAEEASGDDSVDADPGVLQATLRRAAIAITQDDYASALADLLKTLQIDRNYENAFARYAMQEIFKLIGENHELTVHYHKQLRDLMH